MPGLDETLTFHPLGIALLTVSDTRDCGDRRVGRTARGADRDGRAPARRPGHRRRRGRCDPSAGRGLGRRSGGRPRHHHRRHRLRAARRHARGAEAASDPRDGRLLDRLPPGEPRHGRRRNAPVPRLRRPDRRHLPVLPARLDRRLPRRLGPGAGARAGQPLPALLAGRAGAPPQGCRAIERDGRRVRQAGDRPDRLRRRQR